ncbi:probable cytochrome P450 304a1 [Bacillus rossius redtenbacheri]|uniref:probable cytochrome P450 304a1 n=1 Tax=Bacillus rossius redtenbacheri TaxID=93214 RepID=UPI002FDD3FB4
MWQVAQGQRTRRAMLLWLGLLCALLLLAWRYATARPPGFPPGPPRLPLWGSYWFVYLADYRYVYKALAALGRAYRTPVLGLHVGASPAVALLDLRSIKEVFDDPLCQGRVETFLTRARSMGKQLGLIFTDGEMWKNQRRFMLRNMRDLGYARRSRDFERVEQEEVQDLLDLVRGAREDEVSRPRAPLTGTLRRARGPRWGISPDLLQSSTFHCNFLACILDSSASTALKDGCLRLPQALSVGGANALCHAVLGDRFPPAEHQRLHRLAEQCCEAMRQVDATGGSLAVTPWLRHLGPRLFGLEGFLRGTGAATSFFKVHCSSRARYTAPLELTTFFKVHCSSRARYTAPLELTTFFKVHCSSRARYTAPLELTTFFKEYLEERKSSYDENSLRDFFDIYLHKMNQNGEVNGTSDFFSEDKLLMIATDMMLPAIASMAAFISYILLQLMYHPRVMARAQDTLDSAVGKNRLPTLDDRHSLPYIEAIIREALRHQTTAPLAVLRRATADTTVAGYPIAKDTIIIPVLWAAHRDPNVWKNPNDFLPERFLDEDGNLLKRDCSLPFGGGKRVCVGETFARHHVFLFLAALLQNCSFAGPPPGCTLPCPERDVIPGLTVTPPDFQLRVSMRH